ADAICPRLALHTVGAEADADDNTDVVSPDAQVNLQVACEAGLLKVLSKMGISTVDSYRGAQIFEAIGLADEVVEVCFRGTTSTVGGIGWTALGEDVLARHAAAWLSEQPELDSPGLVRDRRGGEYHAHDKAVVETLNQLTGAVQAKPERAVRVRRRDEAAEPVEVAEARADAEAAAADNGVAAGPGQLADMTAAHLLQRAIRGERNDLYEEL